MKKIECEVGVAYGSPGGRWDTVYVVIPEVDDIEKLAIKKAKSMLDGKDVAGLFLYHYQDYEGED